MQEGNIPVQGQAEPEVQIPVQAEAPAAGQASTLDETQWENSVEHAEQTDPQQAPAEQPQQQEEKLLAGKYKTVEELERAYQEAQALISSTRPQVQQQPQQQSEAPDLRVSLFLTEALPSQLAYAETLPQPVVDYMVATYRLTPEQVNELSESDWLRYQQREDRKVESVVQSYQEQTQTAVSAFTQTYPDLVPFMDRVTALDESLDKMGAYSACQTPEEAYAVLARAARATFGLQTPVSEAAAVLGQRGGQVAAQNRGQQGVQGQQQPMRQVPPAPVGGTGAVSPRAGTQQQTGISTSPFERLDDWSV